MDAALLKGWRSGGSSGVGSSARMEGTARLRAGFRCTWWQSSMYSAGGSQGLIQSLHFSGLFVFQNAVSAVVYND
jgi:hypothetical protein